jgi:hypothetical protein
MAVIKSFDSTDELHITPQNAAKVDGSAQTQPVSLISQPLPTNAAEESGGNLAAVKADLDEIALDTDNLSVIKTDLDGIKTDTDKFVFTANGLKTDPSGVVTPVSGTVNVGNLPLTQPVSAVSLPLPANAAAESGGNLAAVKTDLDEIALDTDNLSGIKADLDKLTFATGRLVVDGSGVTTPISAISLPLPAGAAVESGGNLAGIKADLDEIALDTDNLSGIKADLDKQNFDANGNLKVNVQSATDEASNLVQGNTGASGAAVTVTLPAVAGEFHYITMIEITKIFAAANSASATPLVVTTTNLPGSLSYSFGQPVGAIGVEDERIYPFGDSPLKSSVANTATTIVCPATTGIIWKVNVIYFAAP